jgi:2-methylisocitrate lyase-like PEP mutase family enzyme
MNEAMERCRIFREEGADLLFIEALTGVEEMRTFAGSFRGTWANMMPKTPPVSRADLKAMGFTVVTYNVVLAAAVHAMRAALHALVADSPERTPPLMPFDDLTELVGLNDYVKLEQHYGLSDEPQ